MKHGVSTYSYQQKMDLGAMRLIDTVRAAKEDGFEGIELANIPQSEDAAAFLAECQKVDLPVCGYCTSMDYSLDAAEQTRLLRTEIDRAAYFGAPVLRTDIYHADISDPFRREVVESLRAAADYAAEKGIQLTTENHGGYFALSPRLERLFEAVNHPNFGLLCDIGNFQDADEDPARAMGRLISHIRHVHLKDCFFKEGNQPYPGEGYYVTRAGNYIRSTIPGHGSAPLLQCLKLLLCAGYEGWLVQEFEGIEDARYALKQGLANTRRLLKLAPGGTWQATTGEENQ